MPIETECEGCGKRLRLRDDLAGKRVKCPGCGDAIAVPSALEEVEDEPQERPAPRKTAVRQRAEDDRPAIKRRRDDDEDERPVSKRRYDEDDEDDDRPRRRRDEDEEDDRPRRPKKKAKSRKGGGSSLPLILGLVAAVAVLLGGGGALMWALMSRAGGGGSLTAFVPGDGEGFVSIRVSDLMKTDSGKALMEQAKRANPAFGGQNPQMNAVLGAAWEEVERVTYVIKESPSVEDAFYAVVETRATIDRSTTGMTNPTDATHEGKSYTVGGLPGFPGRGAMYFVNSRLFVVGGEPAVKRAITTANKPRPAGPLDDGLALLGGGRHVVAAFNLPPKAVAQMRQQVAQPGAQQFASLAELQSGTVTMSVGSALDVEASLKFPGDAQAQAAKAAADKGLAAMQVGLGGAKANLPPQMQAGFGAVEGALNGAKLEQRGPRLALTFKVEGIANLINGMQGMMPPGMPRR